MEALDVVVENLVRNGCIKGIVLTQCNTQQNISQYVDETSVDNLVGIVYNFLGWPQVWIGTKMWCIGAPEGHNRVGLTHFNENGLPWRHD